jgi:hypothetical protein
MAVEYSVEICKALQQQFRAAKLHRPMRLRRYDCGDELVYDVTGTTHGEAAKVTLIVEKFVGGGFAGQVYRVRITNITPYHNPIEALEAGGVYAMKILIPPSSFARLFRNALYYLGFQAPFQLQVNPAAARASALWQKFIRRGASLRFGNEMAVADIYATFTDTALGSCGELGQWIDGRTWRLEVDENMDLLKKWRKGKITDAAPHLASPEYRAKKQFMAKFVKLLHDMGGYEFARQYEWLTCKSQPNCLKRTDTEDKPAEGLTAVDFRAGLVLLPFLPMSPGDFLLIAKGLKRYSLVQFDRGDIAKLERFVDENPHHFTDMHPMLKEFRRNRLEGPQLNRRIPRAKTAKLQNLNSAVLCHRDNTHSRRLLAKTVGKCRLAKALSGHPDKRAISHPCLSGQNGRESKRLAQGRTNQRRTGHENSFKVLLISISSASLLRLCLVPQICNRSAVCQRAPLLYLCQTLQIVFQFPVA